LGEATPEQQQPEQVDLALQKSSVSKMGFVAIMGQDAEIDEPADVEEPRGRSPAKRSGKSTAKKASV